MIRGQKAMVDSDLADLYRVPTKVFNQAVKRNLKRFPKDFMFRLTAKEIIVLRSQIVTSSWGGRRTLPYAFTEQGVAMLSSVLNSDRILKPERSWLLAALPQYPARVNRCYRSHYWWRLPCSPQPGKIPTRHS